MKSHLNNYISYMLKHGVVARVYCEGEPTHVGTLDTLEAIVNEVFCGDFIEISWDRPNGNWEDWCSIVHNDGTEDDIIDFKVAGLTAKYFDAPWY